MVPIVQVAVTQGGIIAAAAGHPATVQGAVKMHVGIPSSVTDGFGAVGMAGAP